MSPKKRFIYDAAWHKLAELCEARGRYVSAGELAAAMGVARSTALRWLQEMHANGGVFCYLGVGHNGLQARFWMPHPLPRYSQTLVPASGDR